MQPLEDSYINCLRPNDTMCHSTPQRGCWSIPTGSAVGMLLVETSQSPGSTDLLSHPLPHLLLLLSARRGARKQQRCSQADQRAFPSSEVSVCVLLERKKQTNITKNPNSQEGPNTRGLFFSFPMYGMLSAQIQYR